MSIYIAEKNISFTRLNKEILIGEEIELDDEVAEKVNQEMKLSFPDVENILRLKDNSTQTKTRQKKQVETAE
ncbi:hypothetical protein U5S90_03035 [Streptococcus agalactiae]|uniref:hypothetical protein n=1 Tax=Streptococcus agalactiae TaxID=1311 RepID=UPI001374F407|nr:hypothetical protein [Streptococcus agalactiae]KAF1125781.1 hypothetical protein B8U92_09150 [Streptococcus agalactiae]MCD0021674.1 hypothetical protein [Streptococcus agalactiae]